MVPVTPLTLSDVRDRADGTFPVDVLDSCSTALLLFAAGFHGQQDGIFVADAGLTGTCVDIRPQRLHEMAEIYPASWEFVVDDAFDFVSETRRRWDVVSVDCPSGLFERCAAMIDVWCSLARHAVVLGTSLDVSRSLREWPDQWQMTSILRRSNFAGGTYWLVLERP